MVVEAPTPTRTEVTTRDVLLRAADILSEFDWQQGAAGSRAEGAMCAIGAIYEAREDLLHHDDWFNAEVRAACEINGKAKSESSIFPLAVWNDEPGRTKAEVVARLREAAEQW